MREVFKVSFVEANDCFLYLNTVNLVRYAQGGECVKIEFGYNFCQCTYSYLSDRQVVIEENCIGINSDYARLLGIKMNDEVCISKCKAQLLSQVYVRPVEEIYHELINEHYGNLEHTILQKVKIVAKGQTLPIHLYSNVVILITVEKFEPDVQYGQLQERTELVVLDIGDKNATNVNKTKLIPDDGTSLGNNSLKACFFKIKDWLNQAPGVNEMCKDISSYVYNFKKLLAKLQNASNDSSADKMTLCQENYLLKVFERKRTYVYIIDSLLAIENENCGQLINNFCFAQYFPVSKTTDGHCSFKVFCKITKVEKNNQKKNLDLDYACPMLSDSNFTFAYVVTFSDACGTWENNKLYCPDFVMNMLNLKVGSLVEVEEVKRTKELMECSAWNRCNMSSDIRNELVENDIFPEGIGKIYKNTISAMEDNIIFDQKINTLIIGGTGTGKSYLLSSLSKFFDKKYLFWSKIDCKLLSRMKIKDIKKLFCKKLGDCCRSQPSILMIDDLDALIVEEEENTYNTMYMEGIGNLVLNLLHEFQKNNRIYFIATGTYISKFRIVSTDRGPILFDCIEEIKELDLNERNFLLKRFISLLFPYISLNDLPGFDIKNDTKGYNIQDLKDLVEVAVLKSLSNSSSMTELNKLDFESALKEKVPLSLHGLNLWKNNLTKWDDIGGMEEPKNLLKEIFLWPLLYRDIYDSCPLRLQCGVLLYGAPGTGKTLIASAVAREFGLNFISVKGPEIFSKYVGASEQGVRDLFLRAKKAKPALLFFDEFDGLAPRRGSSNDSVNDRVVNQMLTELDGVEELTGVFILAATSRPDLLDPALLRPGRIDKAVRCDLPNAVERRSILEVLCKNLKFSDDVRLEEIVEQTDGYTGADLQAILYRAQTTLVKEIEKDCDVQNRAFILKQHHLLTGFSNTKPSLSAQDKLKYDVIYENFVASRTGGSFQGSSEVQQKLMFT